MGRWTKRDAWKGWCDGRDEGGKIGGVEDRKRCKKENTDVRNKRGTERDAKKDLV